MAETVVLSDPTRVIMARMGIFSKARGCSRWTGFAIDRARTPYALRDNAQMRTVGNELCNVVLDKMCLIC
jgi:hypothetical protein